MAEHINFGSSMLEILNPRSYLFATMNYTQDVESYRQKPVKEFFEEQAAAIFKLNERQTGDSRDICRDATTRLSIETGVYDPILCGCRLGHDKEQWRTGMECRRPIFQYYSLFDFEMRRSVDW